MKNLLLQIIAFAITFSVQGQDQTINGTTFKINGSVGIGTSSPSSELEIENTGEVALYIRSLSGTSQSSATGYLTPQGGSYLGQSGTSGRLLNSANAGDFVIGHRTGGKIILSADEQYNEQHLTISEDGKVGIGTSSTGSHELAVDGSIGAREIKVEAGAWSDFVFEKNYELPTLVEVEEHIKEKGHLKDIPSAEEVKEDGIYLGQMDAKLLQKIEELTLYMIEMNKKMQILEAKNAELEKKINN